MADLGRARRGVGRGERAPGVIGADRTHAVAAMVAAVHVARRVQDVPHRGRTLLGRAVGVVSVSRSILEKKRSVSVLPAAEAETAAGQRRRRRSGGDAVRSGCD